MQKMIFTEENREEGKVINNGRPTFGKIKIQRKIFSLKKKIPKIIL